MITKFLQHAKDWAGQNLTGWYLSEKFDGCRAYWDGQRMWTRQGIEISIPESWCTSLPALSLDGEIFHPSGLAFASNAVRYGGRHFAGCRFVVFDAPEVAGDWPRRIEFARLAGVEVVSFRVAQSTAAAFDYMREIQARGGEGAMARKPGLRYSPGRTAEMLKLKKTTHRNPDAKSEKANFRALANQILATI